MRRSELRVSQAEAIEGLLNLFTFAEQHWCNWDKLEDKIAEIDYDNFDEAESDLFIEFLANVCMRVWRSSSEPPLNETSEDESSFLIKNYDWNAFKFGRQHGVDKDITTKAMFVIDKKNLNDKEIAQLRRKCK